MRHGGLVLRHVTGTIPALAWLIGAATGQAALQSELVVGNLTRPVQVIAPPGDYGRIFVVEQWSGKILIVRDHAVAGTFLTVGPLATGSEQGLLGLAFHPDYAINGKFYVCYCDPDGTWRLAEYLVSADPDVADANSKRILLTQAHPATNHNGGQILFGPDGYLYASLGDSANSANAQDDGTWLGKMLRIDVNGTDPGKQYRVPPTNPFVGAGNPLDEIWAKGFRNPWRFSFDRLTGDLWIGDVGQSQWEEVDFQPAGSRGGQNYGWPQMEGNHCFNPPTGCNTDNTLTLPVFEYSHNGSDGNPFGCPMALGGCAVTGGFVYRGRAIPEAQGRYFFADYCQSHVHSFRLVNGAITDCQNHASELTAGGTISGISSFGEDAAGEIYICAIGNDSTGQGKIFKIVRDPPLTIRGDFDGDLDVDGLDLAAFLNCVGGPEVALPSGCAASDFDGDQDVDMVDFAMIQACFNGPGQPVPASCPLLQR